MNSPTVTGFSERLKSVQDRVEAAALRSGRAGKDIRILAVTKGAALEAVLEAKEAGLGLFAENKVQEAMTKIPQVPAEWHMIGHLQSNKIKSALELFQMIQSIDSVRLAKELNQELALTQRVMPVLLEVNISDENQKFGFRAEDIYTVVDAVTALPQLQVEGLMGMAPNVSDPEIRRAAFKKLKSIFSVLKSVKKERFQMKTLSMGMSDDFEIAIEEGANLVRLGRVLFS